MINNYNLEIFLGTYFKKNVKEITKEEFNSLETISLDGINIDGIYEKINFAEVMGLFPNLKSMIINNYVFSDEDIEHITDNGINEFSFYKCDFTNVDNLDRFSNLNQLLLERCIFNDYEFLYDGFDKLDVLCITNPADEEEIDLEKVSCVNVKEIFLERCIVNNFKALSKFENLEFANLLNTEISKEDLIEIANISSLEDLFVSEKYTDEEVVKLFKEKNKNIKFNINEFLFESEEEV